jgi:hypothetical protein
MSHAALLNIALVLLYVQNETIPDKAARKLLEIANRVEAVQDGRMPRAAGDLDPGGFRV